MEEIFQKILICMNDHGDREPLWEGMQISRCSPSEPELEEYIRRTQIVLTDQPKIAGKAAALGKICIGIQPTDTGEYFTGAQLVAGSISDLEEKELQELYCREKGIPVTIARTERLIMREIAETDIPFLAGLGKQEWMQDALQLQDRKTDFFLEENLQSYRKNVYRFYGYGLWIVLLLSESSFRNSRDSCSSENESGIKEKNLLEGHREEIPIGICGFADVGEETQLQYALLPAWRGKGYAQEMCRGALTYLKESINCDQVSVRIRKENLPSVRLAEKLGFQRDQDTPEIIEKTEIIKMTKKLHPFASP